MKISLINIALLLSVLLFSCSTKSNITFFTKETDKQIDVLIDGELFTTYQWPDNVCKPFLYPVCTSSGTVITRGYPLNPRAGERVDHDHQIGMWLTYGNVEGYDFWGNGYRGLGTRNENGGVIKHIKVEKISEGKGEGIIKTLESWEDPSGKELLKEHTEYHFIAKGATRIIDRISTLTAPDDKEISMPDTKEGMFAIRVARQLEIPEKGELSVYSSDGNLKKTEGLSDHTVSGNYISSEGVTGLEVWGTRARWMDLFGNIGDEKITLVICDHPQNPCYPTYWHARGYGLFSANPLGAKKFTNGMEEMKFSIPAGKSRTFRYRLIVYSGSHLLNVAEINAYADDFAKKYH